VRTNHPELFPDQSNLHPIPFFGDIRRAEVLTLALNPARTEFEHGRYWLPNKDDPSLVAPVLTTRLLHYFDLPVPAPHEWFRTFEDTLHLLGCSYRTNAAHIDVHPLPTKFRRELGQHGLVTLGRLIEGRGATHLQQVLALMPRPKLVLVIDYSFNLANGNPTCTFDYLRENVETTVRLVVADGSRPLIFRGGGKTGFNARVTESQQLLRNHLQN